MQNLRARILLGCANRWSCAPNPWCANPWCTNPWTFFVLESALWCAKHLVRETVAGRHSANPGFMLVLDSFFLVSQMSSVGARSPFSTFILALTNQKCTEARETAEIAATASKDEEKIVNVEYDQAPLARCSPQAQDCHWFWPT